MEKENKSLSEKKETCGEFLTRLGMDGNNWAREFMKMFENGEIRDIDVDLMRAWFCNSIMAGYDKAKQLDKQSVKDAYETLCNELIENPNRAESSMDRISQVEIRRVFKDKFGFEVE